MNIQIQGGEVLQQLILNNMAAQTELSRYFFQDENFRQFITKRIIEQAKNIAKKKGR